MVISPRQSVARIKYEVAPAKPLVGIQLNAPKKSTSTNCDSGRLGLWPRSKASERHKYPWLVPFSSSTLSSG